MNENERKKARVLGFKVNNTVITVLFYFSFTTIIGLIYFLYYNMIMSISLSDLLTMGFQIMSILVFFFITWISGSFSVYIIISCIINRKLVENNEGIKIKWFSFRLNKTSLVILFVLAIPSLVSVIQSVFNSIGFLITYSRISYLPTFFLIQQIITLISSIILVCFYIYTLVVCGKNYKRFEESDIII
jgi:hypothetical protein